MLTSVEFTSPFKPGNPMQLPVMGIGMLILFLIFASEDVYGIVRPTCYVMFIITSLIWVCTQKHSITLEKTRYQSVRQINWPLIVASCCLSLMFAILYGYYGKFAKHEFDLIALILAVAVCIFGLQGILYQVFLADGDTEELNNAIILYNNNHNSRVLPTVLASLNRKRNNCCLMVLNAMTVLMLYIAPINAQGIAIYGVFAMAAILMDEIISPGVLVAPQKQIET